jgi:hypothetical protein
VPAGFSLPYQPLAFRQHHLFEATVQRLKSHAGFTLRTLKQQYMVLA